MPLENGTVFAGYTIQRLLGSGGMGEVYLTQHPRLPRLEALKILPASLTDDADFRERFNREAELAATLWHPNIVGLHDRGEFDGQLWITMDYVDGTDALRALRAHSVHGLTPAEVLEIVTGVADALDYAHQRNLLHRDVKPANVLLTNAGAERRRILLADFGIARRTDDISGLTATNMTVGSYAYAAPEQLMGEPMDGRADQYALAATAFHLLAGQPPFPQANAAAVIAKHLIAPPPLLAQHKPELAPLDPVLSKALAKDPAQRYSRCLDFAHALAESVTTARAHEYPTQSAMVTAPTQAAPSWPTTPLPAQHPMPGIPRRPQRLRPAAVIVPLILAVLLIGAAGFAVTQVLRPDPQPSSAAPQWQPYVDYAKHFAVLLTSLSAHTSDRDLQLVLDGSTGPFHDDFSNFRQAINNSNVTNQGTVNGAGLDSISGTTARVLVAATVQVTSDNGAAQDPQRYRLRMQVEKIGDAYKVAQVEFVS